LRKHAAARGACQKDDHGGELVHGRLSPTWRAER
jgi:hypothetical protein